MKYHRFILSVLLSLLAWQIVNAYIVEITFWQFILVEIIIAIFELFTKFAVNKATGEPTNFQDTEESFWSESSSQDKDNLSH